MPVSFQDLDIEDQVVQNCYESYDRKPPSMRYYCLTIKPVKREYKGKVELLSDATSLLLDETNGQLMRKSVEKDGTSMVHVHALIYCELIQSKKELSKLFNGYHLHLEMIKVREEDNVRVIWDRYIFKERSTADSYHEQFGNMFLETL